MTGSSVVEASEPTVAVGVDHSVAVLAAVADPVRWTVLRRLADGEACVCQLQAEAEVAPNLLSYHLRVLRKAGLVTCARRGRWIDYKLAEDALARLSAALPIAEGPEPHGGDTTGQTEC